MSRDLLGFFQSFARDFSMNVPTRVILDPFFKSQGIMKRDTHPDQNDQAAHPSYLFSGEVSSSGLAANASRCPSGGILEWLVAHQLSS